MRQGSLRALACAVGLVLSGVAISVPADAAPGIVTNAATGDVTVTLADNTAVLVPAALASQVLAAMNAGDAATVTDAIKAIVLANAADNPDLATAIYVLAANAAANPALQAAAYAGVVAGCPSSATEVADNATNSGGTPSAGSGNNNGLASNFPNGGTSGSGSSPSVDIP